MGGEQAQDLRLKASERHDRASRSVPPAIGTKTDPLSGGNWTHPLSCDQNPITSQVLNSQQLFLESMDIKEYFVNIHHTSPSCRAR